MIWAAVSSEVRMCGGAPMVSWWQRLPRWLRAAVTALATAVLCVTVFWVGPWLLTRHPSRGLTPDQELAAENAVRTTLVQAVGALAVAGGLVVTYRTYKQNQNDQRRRWDDQDRTYQLNL